MKMISLQVTNGREMEGLLQNDYNVVFCFFHTGLAYVKDPLGGCGRACLAVNELDFSKKIFKRAPYRSYELYS
jgi:hypothetical protein